MIVFEYWYYLNLKFNLKSPRALRVANRVMSVSELRRFEKECIWINKLIIIFYIIVIIVFE